MKFQSTNFTSICTGTHTIHNYYWKIKKEKRQETKSEDPNGKGRNTTTSFVRLYKISSKDGAITIPHYHPPVR